MVARGDTQHISEGNLPQVATSRIPDKALKTPLKGDAMTRVTLTKFASLCRSKISNKEKFKSLIRWMHQEFLHYHTVTHLALYQLSPHSKKPILKKVHSPKIEKVYREIENAHRDLLLLRYWCKASIEGYGNNTLVLFVTADTSLLDLARLVLHSTLCEQEMQNSFRQRLIELWGETTGGELSNFYLSMKQITGSPDRASNQPNFPSHYEHLEAVRSDLELCRGFT